MARLIIVSNRLPVKLTKTKNGFKYNMSTGGVATGLKSFYKSYDAIWVGWPGQVSNKLSKQHDKITETLREKYNCEPVFLTRTEIQNYYLGYSNKSIWPLCHYFTQYVTCNDKYWKYYQKVNQKFANKISQMVEEDDIVWVHDYHLMLLPRMLRKQFPNLRIGYFHHIPFPSYEIFRLLPSRKKILNGLLGSDLIGFHTYDYLRHFQSSVQRLLGCQSNLGKIDVDDRIVKVDSFPMGIDFEKFSAAAEKTKVKKNIKTLRNKIKAQKVILSMDRLDYTKGIVQRLQAYEQFLKENPKIRGSVKFIVVTVPSREEVDQYFQLKKTIERLVSRINGEYGVLGWMPIWYLHKSFDFENLVALYNVSDIYVVTPLRDGMNLMAKEYLASRNDNAGLLILSEMAGAAKELGETIVVNPNDVNQIVKALKEAIFLPTEKIIERNTIMSNRLARYNVKRWAEDFFQKLMKMKEIQQQKHANILNQNRQQKILNDFNKAINRLLLIDYDDTLFPYNEDHSKLKPSPEIKNILRKLSRYKKTKVVLLSELKWQKMQEWFRDVEIDMVAEQGAYVKHNGEWEKFDVFENEWKDDLKPIFQLYVDRTPGSRMSEKDYSLIWDYEKAAFDLGGMRSRE
ncbi:MAG: bifunctional alpha,alpha-trehalose-phosphate synthase (UDP-forming)/trehalose-phosphatase, partial [Candidatus Cloacimonadota bacterium]|nr:bifunctional alpha,alpha-trehalose-phosphate synthase (UDP-forming)/trehalose-phosphatase [Candidatus Cloacimonadota bacterium]